MANMTKKPRSGKLLLSTSFALAIIVGTSAWRRTLDADPQVPIPPYPKLPAPNGFDLYVRTAQMILTANPHVDEIDDASPPTDPKIRAQKYSLANRRAWLQSNAAGFALFQTALKTPCLAPDMRSDSPFALRSWAKMRQLAREKIIEVHTREMSGDWNGAVQSRLDIVQLGNDMAQGGPLMPTLVGSAVEAIGRHGDWDDTDHLNSEQTRAAIGRLETLYNRRFTAANAWQEDKWLGLSLLLRGMHNNPSWRKTFTPILSPLQHLTIFALSKRVVAENVARVYDTQIANARLPYLAPKAPLPPNDPITEVIVLDSPLILTSFARNDAGNALWLTTLGLHAYQLDHKTYPPNLAALVPHYLKHVPADPFGGGEILRYKLSGNAYTLWSIGPDGVDNGGVPIKSSYTTLPGQTPSLPMVGLDSKGDYVAGKNR